jgi:LemA protein
MTPLIILLVVIVVLVLWIAGTYNGLVGARNQTDEALSDIDVQTKRRHDLIPNLVESVKGYAAQEKGVLEDVTKARADAISAGGQGMEAQQKAENVLTGALRSVFAVAENYPDLKSSANFMQLSGELTDTENKIEAARRFYNANVRDFNTRLQRFPTNMIGNSLHFTARPLFVVEDPSEKEAPKVSFS